MLAQTLMVAVVRVALTFMSLAQTVPYAAVLHVALSFGAHCFLSCSATLTVVFTVSASPRSAVPPGAREQLVIARAFRCVDPLTGQKNSMATVEPTMTAQTAQPLLIAPTWMTL